MLYAYSTLIRIAFRVYRGADSFGLVCYQGARVPAGRQLPEKNRHMFIDVPLSYHWLSERYSHKLYASCNTKHILL